jgi:hypothetical protein
MLYEQAGVDGSAVKRRDGSVMTYRETVHHQFISSMANLKTTADHRAELLTDFYNEKKRATGNRGRGKSGAFVVAPSDNGSRLDRFASTLQGQNIDVEVASEAFKLRRATTTGGKEIRGLEMPKGSLIIRLDQPMRALLETILQFDIRLTDDFLEIQRKEVLKHNRSKLYENTGWSLLLGYNLASYRTESVPGVKTTSWTATPVAGGIEGGSPKYGYAVDNADDRSYVLLARLLERGYKVWGARKEFNAAGRAFAAGGYVIRNSGNEALAEAELEALAQETGVRVYGVNSSLGRPGADLGGAQHFHIRVWRHLAPPRQPVELSRLDARRHRTGGDGPPQVQRHYPATQRGDHRNEASYRRSGHKKTQDVGERRRHTDRQSTLCRLSRRLVRHNKFRAPEEAGLEKNRRVRLVVGMVESGGISQGGQPGYVGSQERDG